MKIIRSNKSGGFTQIDNKIVKDRRMSPEAKIILLFLLSNNESWNITERSLMFCTGLKQFSVRKALAFLVENNFLKRGKAHYKNGHIEYYDYIVTELPEDYIGDYAFPT